EAVRSALLDYPYSMMRPSTNIEDRRPASAKGDLPVSGPPSPLPPSWTKLQLKPDDKCGIKLAGQTVITGSIEIRPVAEHADPHGIKLRGKSQTVWAAKSSVSSKDGNFDGMTFEQVARKVLEPYHVGVKVVGELNARPYDKLQSNPGENVWDFLE